MHTEQRPKMEDFEDYLFIVLKMFQYDEKENETKTEQVSIILSSNYIISFQEDEGDVFDLIRERIRTDRGRIRKMGVDYLAYSLIDAIVDNYFMVLEKIGERIEDIEDEMIKNPTPEVLHTIHSLKTRTDLSPQIRLAFTGSHKQAGKMGIAPDRQIYRHLPARRLRSHNSSY